MPQVAFAAPNLAAICSCKARSMYTCGCIADCVAATTQWNCHRLMTDLFQQSIQQWHVVLLGLDGVREKCIGFVGQQSVNRNLFDANQQRCFTDVFLYHCPHVGIFLQMQKNNIKNPQIMVHSVSKITKNHKDWGGQGGCGGGGGDNHLLFHTPHQDGGNY